MQKALITGISGQDGSYLAEHLIDLGYAVFGLVRRNPQTMRWLSSHAESISFQYGDMRDAISLETAFLKAWPDEIYNLAACVYVPQSWTSPAETFDVNVGGLARLLQLIEKFKPDTKLYQASSSEIFGNTQGP